MQRGDFLGNIRAMNGLPVTIRLLDPPLPEFIPHGDEDIAELAATIGVAPVELAARRDALHETNPMLGLRAAGSGSLSRDLPDAGTRIMEAACELIREKVKVLPEIMIRWWPTCASSRSCADRADALCREIIAAARVKVPYSIGHHDRGAARRDHRDEIARAADFFSSAPTISPRWGWACRADDARSSCRSTSTRASSPPIPSRRSIRRAWRLMRIGIEKGRRTRPDLKIGICGEHGGDPLPSSSVTRSPRLRFLLAVSRADRALAAAQAALAR